MVAAAVTVWPGAAVHSLVAVAEGSRSPAAAGGMLHGRATLCPEEAERRQPLGWTRCRAAADRRHDLDPRSLSGPPGQAVAAR